MTNEEQGYIILAVRGQERCRRYCVYYGCNHEKLEVSRGNLRYEKDPSANIIFERVDLTLEELEIAKKLKKYHFMKVNPKRNSSVKGLIAQLRRVERGTA